MHTVRDAAKILNVSPGLVYALCAEAAIEHERHGLGRGTIRISDDALRAYRERATVGRPRRRSVAAPGAYRELNAKRLASEWAKRGAVPTPARKSNE